MGWAWPPFAKADEILAFILLPVDVSFIVEIRDVWLRVCFRLSLAIGRRTFAANIFLYILERCCYAPVLFLVHHKYVITIFQLLASPMLMHAMPIQILRHHGDTISPRTGYHYSAILAMINREYLSTDHYSIMTEAGTVTFMMRLSLADKADLLVQLVRRRRELTLSWFFSTWRLSKFIN